MFLKIYEDHIMVLCECDYNHNLARGVWW
jgi:hypothetical protein